MNRSEVERLRSIRRFDSLVKYLRDDLGWPIEAEDFEDLTFHYEAEELGIDPKTAAKIHSIKQFRPLTSNQPWGIFFVKFEPKKLPVVALRRILSQLVIKKRASAKKAEQASWNMHDLLFISNYGDGDQRQISFAQFTGNGSTKDLPTLKVLGWDKDDTNLHIDHAHKTLKANLSWNHEFETDIEFWREKWASAFILKHREVITTSKRLAEELADLAQRICIRAKQALSIETEQGPLRRLHKAFQSALIHDLSEDDFADMYAQTIAYGLLAARVENPKAITSDAIADMVPITNPFLKDMMGTFLTIGGKKKRIDFDELGIQDVVDLLNSPETHMDAILMDFGNRTRQEDPVIHFYESFLAVYDKKRKVERGVFYTPLPVVSYIVRSVHELLKTEFALEDGLASTVTWGEMAKKNKDITIPEGVSKTEPFVQILDPATGTATFLVEVIDVIHRAMEEKWQREGHMPLEFQKLWNEYVPKHLLPRLYGFELMMAPYAIAHMKIGLKLKETGYDFGSKERAHVYLTNSLEPANEAAEQPAFEEIAPALAHEARAVNAIKDKVKFTVIIGNPPYSGHSANKGVWIHNLLRNKLQDNADSYFKVDGKPLDERNPKWLNDDYVKFIRYGQFQISNSGYGILSFITNNSYLDSPTFRGMRKSLIESFSQLRLYDLHGSTKRKEVDRSGNRDINVFDIEQGVAINILYKNLKQKETSIRQYDLYGLQEHKYKVLLGDNACATEFSLLNPTSPYYLFVPYKDSNFIEYNEALKIIDIFKVNSVGIVTARDKLTIHSTPEDVKEVVWDFANLTINQARIKYSLGKDAQDWKVSLAQEDANASGPHIKHIHPILYRPFDLRHTYYTGRSRGFMCRPRPEVMVHMLNGLNMGLHICRQIVSDNWRHVFITNRITDDCYVSNKTRERGYTLPLYLYHYNKYKGLDISADPTHNFTNEFLRSLAHKLCLQQNKDDFLPVNITPEAIFYYAYAILLSPTYRTRYATLLKIDFPRLPLTGSLELFKSLSLLGDRLVSLHLMKSPELGKHITKFIGDNIPKVEKISYSDETVWIDRSKSTGFKGVPEEVWNFFIGGYQVCHKWLKDRKGLILSEEEIDHYHRMIVAINETICIMNEIDKVIDAHGGWPGAFLTDKAKKKEYTTNSDPDLQVTEEKPAYQSKKSSSTKQPPFPKKNDWKAWQKLSAWAKSGSINKNWIDFASTVSNKIKKGSKLTAKEQESMKKCWKEAVKNGFRS